MLTSDLLRFQVSETAITPRYLKRRHAAYYLQIATDLIEIFKTHTGKSRRDLETALNDYESDLVGYKIIRGLAKVLDGFAEYDSPDALDYAQIRRQLFEFAETYRPIVRQADLVHQQVVSGVLARFEQEHGPLPQDLYGDLPDQQILRRVDGRLTPESLLRRYNLALAQGILYRCHRMEIKIWDGYKTVFRYLKLARLMHKIRRLPDHYFVEVDGPFALFRKTQKYGVNLARFLPALLLAKKWQMVAAVNTEHGQRTFDLDQDCGLATHYRDETLFDSAVEEAFYANFVKRKTEWVIERESEIIDLGDTVLIPDFKLVHPDGRQALLEIVGFWTPEYLSKKLDKLKRANRKDLIVAVNANLNCSREAFQGPVIFYKTRLKVKDVLQVLQEQEGGTGHDALL
ncbi:MAG: DUF790 family protein [bacterium]